MTEKNAFWVGLLFLTGAYGLLSIGYADDPVRGRYGGRWVSGTLDGEAKTDVNDRVSYEDHNYFYSQIAERRVGEINHDLGLDVFLMSLPRDRDFDTTTMNGGSEWGDLNELMLVSSNSYINADVLAGTPYPGMSDYPSRIGIYLQEPKEDGSSITRSAPSSITSWTST